MKLARYLIGLWLLLPLFIAAGPASAADRETAFCRVWAETAFSLSTSQPLPFSFVYGGRASSTFIGAWPRRIEDRVVDVTKRIRTLTITDPLTKLQISAVCTIYLDSPGADWTLTFKNTGTADTPVIELLKALDVSITPGPGPAPILHRLKGSTCADDDWLPFDQPLSPGVSQAFGAQNGRSSADSPFFNIQYGGGGVITAVGWSGQWRGTVEETAGGALKITAYQQNLHTVLHAGESLRSPRILQLYWLGDDPFRGYNLFRRTMLDHIVPRMDGKPVPPPIVHLSTSFYEMNDSTQANVMSHLKAAEGLGFEVFWLDAYWTKGAFPGGMGNYGFPLAMAEPADRFPKGLKPIGDAAHAAGMEFLVWFEPERVAAGTFLAAKHPDWVIGGGKGGLLDLGNDQARAHMTAYLKAVIAAYASRLAALRLQYRSARLLEGPRHGREPRRHGRNALHRRIVQDVGRSPGRLSAPPHR